VRSDRRPRDAQRARCYRAEEAVRDQLERGGRRFGSVADMEAYVEALRHAAWFAAACGGVAPAIRVGAGSGSRRARATYRMDTGAQAIQVPRAARRESVLLHELAHCAVVARCGLHGAAAHGWQWAATYLQLVERRLGPSPAAALRDAFGRQRVRWQPPS
jgi:putative metallohydrolase (TIGR04338 family)